VPVAVKVIVEEMSDSMWRGDRVSLSPEVDPAPISSGGGSAPSPL